MKDRIFRRLIPGLGLFAIGVGLALREGWRLSGIPFLRDLQLVWLFLALGLLLFIILAALDPTPDHIPTLAWAFLGGAPLLALFIWFGAPGVERWRPSELGWIRSAKLPFSLSTATRGEFLINPQETWRNSQLSVDSGQAITVLSAGRVYISLQRLVEAAAGDTLPLYAWVGPSGELHPRPDSHPGREECLLAPRIPYGALLMAVSPDLVLDTKKARTFRHDSILFRLGPVRQGLEAQRDGYLHFAVNDVYIDDSACDSAFVADGRDPETPLYDNLGMFSARVVVR